MKKNFLIVLIALFFVSCNDKEKNMEISEYTVTDFKYDIQLLGSIHNECMDYVIRHLNANDIENIMTKSEYYGLSFLNSYGFSDEDVEQVLFSFERNYYRRFELDTVLWFQDDVERLSEDQKKVLRLINNVIESNDNIGSLLSNLEQVEDSIIRNGTYETQYIAIVAVEIAKSSLTYWYNNEYIWRDLVDMESKERWFNWKSVGREDVKGAVAGATGVGVASVVSGPPGWAAGTATVVGSSAGASLADAAGQVWDHFFGK